MTSSRPQFAGNGQHQPPHVEMARNVTQALLNPYAHQQFHLPYSAHYANAYAYATYTTPEGYTLSSTYDPHAYAPAYSPSFSSKDHSNKPRGQHHNPRSNPTRTSQQNSSWYQPGSFRCTSEQCTFTGSAKSVEIHMMDRHLIYPPGWNKNKRKGSDWDADPSLKGKTVPIQGTSIVLDSQEALDAWIAERKRRWPTTHRVEEKKTKMEEAIARGQLPLMCSGPQGRKRRREDNYGHQQSGKRMDRRDANKRHGRNADTKLASENPSRGISLENKPESLASQVKQRSDNSDCETDNEAPEVLSSKAPTSILSIGDGQVPQIREDTMSDPVNHLQSTRKSHKSRLKEPKLPPRNPFASRPTLLRNLLLPEIRVTISNLSQAIRFLVDNDFLRDVELEPGQANQRLIEVVDSKPNGPR